MRLLWILSGLSWLVVGLPVAAAKSQPNILLILADDVGSDAIGCYGGQSYPTPHIDALAHSGLRFTHAYAMPVCHPTRICLMTGRYPFRFGSAGSKWGGFPEVAESLTIAHRMRRGGYATAVAGKWQLCLMKNDLDHPRTLGFDQWCLFGWHEGGRYHDPTIYQNGQLRDDTAGRYGPDLYVEFLIDFMRRNQQAGKPFFAYYSMALCHDVTDDLGDEQVAYYKDGRWMTYAEMVSSMDDMVGRLITALEELGLREETLVIFTTDNGTARASYFRVDASGKWIRNQIVSVRNGKVVPGGKGRLDDTGTRVPLIINWPGRIEAGTDRETLVDMTDYLPTLAELAGLPPDGVPRDGKSFASALSLNQTDLADRDRRDSVNRDWVYIEHKGQRCVRSRDWKLYADGRFFDLRGDPTEAQTLPLEELKGLSADAYAELNTALKGLQGSLD